MEKILFLDTCGSRLILSFIFNEEIISIKKINTNKNMTEIFNDELEKFFIKNNVQKNEINKIYLINGPGSFVGIKVGIVFANLYSFLNDCSIYFLDGCTFQATKNNAISIIDARGNLFYTKKIDDDKEISLMSLEEIKNLSNNKIEIINNYDNYNFKECWKFNKNKFKKTTEVKGNYVKEPI